MKKLMIISAFLIFTGFAFGQTIQKGAVIAIRTSADLVLKPEVSMNQYLDVLMNKWGPEMQKLFPGSKMYVLKGDRGAMANGYAMVWYFENEAARAKYFTSEGVLKDESLGVKMQELNNMLYEYAIDLGFGDYTDWIVL